MAHYQQNGYNSRQWDGSFTAPSTCPTTNQYDYNHPRRLSAARDAPQLRRVPSFNIGDDSVSLDTSRAHNVRAADENARYTARAPASNGGNGYMASGSAGVYDSANEGLETSEIKHAPLPAGFSPQSGFSRASSQSSTVSGYPYPDSFVQPAPPTQRVYNPQQYGPLHTQVHQSAAYNFSAYAPSSNSPLYSVANSPHPPYNPAAYQAAEVSAYGPSNVQRQSSVAAYYGHAPSAQSSYNATAHQVTPPLPVPGPEQAQGSAQSSRYVSSAAEPQYNYYEPYSNSAGAFPSHLAQADPTSSNRPYSRNSPADGYGPQTPVRSEFNTYSSFRETPPRPPVHLYGEDGYDKRRPSTRRSGRSLPTPPVQQTEPRFSSPQRTDTLTRHPQARPLPGPPVDADEGVSPLSGVSRIGSLHQTSTENLGYEELMQEVEAAVMQNRPSATRRHSSEASNNSHQKSVSEDNETDLSDTNPTLRLSPDERHTHTNGNIATGTGLYINYDAYSDDSDAEAAAGLAMLQMADEEERAREERLRERIRDEAPTYSEYLSQTADEAAFLSDDSDSNDEVIGHDLALYGGGYDGRVHYGDTYEQQMGERNAHDQLGPSFCSPNFPNADGDRVGYSGEYPSIEMPRESLRHIHDYLSIARVDAAGTGGLSEPTVYDRRMSFDYGDETEGPLTYPQEPNRSASESSDKIEPADLSFHPGMRPLPPAPVEPARNANLLPLLIPAGTYRHQEQSDLQSAQYPQTAFQTTPVSHDQAQRIQSPVPRSSSLMSHPSGPRTDTPTRSKTDSDRVKSKQQQELFRQQQMGALQLPPAPPAMMLDLPAIPAGRRKKFNPAKLSPEDFDKCAEPWALSAVLAWIRDLAEEETDLKDHALIDAIVGLFTHKVPTMNMADAETLAARVIKNMLDEEALIKEEEWVKLGPGTLSGVLFQLTGEGCFSITVHAHGTEHLWRCYSHHCMRTLKKVDLKTETMEPQRKVEDWVTFYKVTKSMLESYPKKEIDRQNNLHEIVTTEDAFIAQLDVLRELYRDQLAAIRPPVIEPKRLKKFLDDVFGRVDAVKKVNEDFLLAQLKYRQREQGPFIVGFSDIFREWIRKAKTVYVEYAKTFPQANYLVRREAERNVHFQQFLNQVREHKLSNRLSWQTYLKAPITRIQRYTLLLSTVHKNMVKDSEEKANLAQAIEEIKVVATECDNKVGDMSKKINLSELATKLQLRPEMEKLVELNLDHFGREIIFEGNLQRPGTRTRFNLLDIHAILFDHYLVLAKKSIVRGSSKTFKYETYDVSKLPIPMDLLVLESANDEPVVKSSLAPSLGSSRDEEILYPFRIKHLGKPGSYTLYAPSLHNRQEWCSKIVEAKTKHAVSLFAQNAEPFRLRVLADTAFGYSDLAAHTKSVVIKSTPLDRAIQDVEKLFPRSGPRPTPICRANVHCATVFQQPPGLMKCAIGTDFGVYISDYDDPRGWVKAIPIMRVTQIAVLEEFNLFLLITEKSLVAYSLDSVCPLNGIPSSTSWDSVRKAPQKLSGSKEVGFFVAGQMKDRILVMYKKRDGLTSRYKILEPVLQKSPSSRTRAVSTRRGETVFFREFDEFYIPTESYGINLFHSSLAISTQRGVEVLTLDKKLTWSVPILRSETPEVQTYLDGVAHRIKDLRPLGMFRLSDSEFLVAYEECAVYINKNGDVSRSVVMEFVGRAQTACLYGRSLILFNEDFVEVRNAMNGRLRQVIPGHNVICLDEGRGLPGSFWVDMQTNNPGGSVDLAGGPSSAANGSSSFATTGRTVKFCMQHPEFERRQIVLELIENEGQKD